MCPYKEKYRQFVMRVVNGKCQWESYSEKKGFFECKEPAREVHHPIPERVLLAKGFDPEHAVPGFPVCSKHHSRNLKGEIFNEGSSFHPDMGEAYKHYREWKQNKLHMMSITGKPRTMTYEDSPFADAAKVHDLKVAENKRFHTGTHATDRYYINKMNQKILTHVITTGERPPIRSPHPQFDPSKRKKKWYEGLF